MKIGETVFAAVRHDGIILGGPEGDFIADSKEIVKNECRMIKEQEFSQNENLNS